MSIQQQKSQTARESKSQLLDESIAVKSDIDRNAEKQRQIEEAEKQKQIEEAIEKANQRLYYNRVKPSRDRSMTPEN